MWKKLASFTLLVVSIFLIGIFDNREVYAGGNNNCSDIQCTNSTCGSQCGLDANGNPGCCCTEYTCNGGDNVPVNCGPGYYWSNRGCIKIGSGSPPPDNDPPPPNCEPLRVNCPQGTVRTTVVTSSVCHNKSLYNNCYQTVGSAQSITGDCSCRTVPGECWKDCWTNPKTGVTKCWTECDPDETVCSGKQYVTYRCDPVAPPVEVVLSMSSNGETMGCTAVPGYVGKNANNIVRVTTTIPTSYGGGTITDIRTWLGASPASTDAISSTVSQALANNHQLGIMVRKVGSVWTDVYAPSKYATNGNVGTVIQSWVRIGSVGSGYRGEIKGPNGRSLASISNVSVTTSGSNSVLTYDIAFYSDVSGLQSYETGASTTYQVFATAKFSNGTTVPNWTNSGDMFVLDLLSPTQESLNFTFAGGTLVDLLWRFTDVDPISGGNGMARVIGNASRINTGRVEGPIDDTTSGVLNYVLGSGGTNSATLYTSTDYLWRVNGSATRTERIDVKTNEGGSINFAVNAFDKACNMTLGNTALPLGDPWIITKAGVAYSEGGSVYEVPTLLYTTATERLSNDTYWNAPFAFYKSDADMTTEVVSSSTSALNNLLYSVQLKSVRLLNKRDLNNKSEYWFDKLTAKLDTEVSDTPADFVVVTNAGNMTAPARSTLITDGTNTCVNDRFCVVEVSGNLTVNAGYVCDARTLFVVEGTTTINPDIGSNGLNNGCMFLNRGDVTINPGTYKSGGSTYAKFDQVAAFFVTDGTINIAYGDSGQTHRDGLKVVGSLIAFGGTRSVEVERSLTLMDANSFPSVAIHFDGRYLNFASKFFGGDTEGFKSEVGFKPL
ncbi:MAG TPA: hypothetical protein PLV59_00095 [Candidatus Dojkabacteria bacterium]|nr:hypothetical protein [Candidatus Dojkabacteria bacterium]